MAEFDNIKKILIFRLCCLGDVAVLTPVIINLHGKFPGAEIKIAASKWIENLLPYLPYIDDSIVFDVPFGKGLTHKIIKTIKFILLLRKEKFDLVYLAHRHNFYGLLLKFSGVRFRLGFSETKHLTHTSAYNHNAHVVDRHLEVLSNNGIEVNDNDLCLNKKREKREILAENGFNEDKFIIGIFPFGGSNPGTQMEIKRWEYEKYIELINILAAKNKDKTIIFFEGRLESEKIQDEFSNSNIRKLTITNDLISICNIFMSGDTGSLYIAEGLKISTLSIFGPSDPVKLAPKSSHKNAIHKYIWKKPYCSPCYTDVTAYDRKNTKYWDGDTFICNTGTHECIKSISVDEVKKVLDEMIEELVEKAKKNT